MSIFLYKFPLRIQLHQVDRGIPNMSRPLVDNDFKVYKGVQTDIDFLVKNNDRKPVTLAGRNAYIIIRENETKTEVLKKKLRLIDESKGFLQLVLTPAEVELWEEGYYDYIVLIENRDGSQNILFTSQDQDARGVLELKGGALPPISQSIDLDPSQFIPTHYGVYPGGITRWISTPVPGDAKLGFVDGLHTFVLYIKNFTGKLWLQGSLEGCSPTNETDWFNISLTSNTFELAFNNCTGIEPYNFSANVSWIRFVIEKDDLNIGDITRILYKP